MRFRLATFAILRPIGNVINMEGEREVSGGLLINCSGRKLRWLVKDEQCVDDALELLNVRRIATFSLGGSPERESAGGSDFPDSFGNRRCQTCRQPTV
jgi:hypothetical protein